MRLFMFHTDKSFYSNSHRPMSVSNEEQDFHVGDILKIFGSNQQKISAAETKIIQLKRASQHKDEHIKRLLEEQTSIQNESYDLNKRESAISIELECLQEASKSLKISRTNTQLELSKKERQLAEVTKVDGLLVFCCAGPSLVLHDPTRGSCMS